MERTDGRARLVRGLVAGMLVCAFVAPAGAADRQKGIKMLIAAATASRHHHPSGSAADPGTDDHQGGIKKLIAAATASRHVRPLSGSHPRGAKDAGSSDEGTDTADRAVQDIALGSDPAPAAANPKAASASSAAPATANGAAVSGGTGGSGAATATTGGAVAPATGTPQGPAPGVAVGSAKASAALNPTAAASHGPPTTIVRAASPNPAGISGTGLVRPTAGIVGGAAIVRKNVASISGSMGRPKR